jgi:tetratricopeptide (TPR) repeat protein
LDAAVKPPSPADQLQEQVHALLERNEQPTALDLLAQPADVEPAVRHRLREEVRVSWHDKARKEHDEKQYERASQTAQEILDRFPDDFVADNVRQDSLNKFVPEKTDRLVAEGRFGELNELLLTRDLPPGLRQNCDERLRDAWLGQIADELAAGRYDTAKGAVASLPARFSDHAHARAIRAIEQQIRAGNYLAADTALREGRKQPPEKFHDRFDRIGERLLKDWGDRAERRLSEGNEREAERIASEIRAIYPNDRRAADILRRVEPAPVKDVREAIETGNAKLDTDPEAARAYFKIALDKSQKVTGRPELPVQAHLGRARALARVQNWAEVHK